MIKAQIITIGDEILIGQITDTNSVFISQKMNETGITVTKKVAVADKENEIIRAMDEALQESDVVLMTGGLGPTKDDITKTTICKFFGVSLRFDEASYQNITALFKSRGREVSELNRKQAEVPANCRVIPNLRGTAPGMWFEKDSSVLISMPGVPQEMKAIMDESIIPLLKEKFKTPFIYHKNILTQGIGESMLAELIEGWENKLPPGIKLAYLPSVGQVRLRLSATGADKNEVLKKVSEQVEALKKIAGKFIYGYDDDTLEKIIGIRLREKNKTVCTAESCTGGFIAHKITSVPGSSDYFKGSVVAYANEVKEKILSVPAKLISEHGAVSEDVVKKMAENARKVLNTDFSIACSGIAGPDGGTDEKPVGTVWIAVASSSGVKAKLLQLGTGRLKVIEETALNALNMLRKEMGA
jgi:nicotinamide-nucleotide amidase